MFLSIDLQAEIGQYVTLRIKDVQKHLYIDHVKTGSPLAVFGLLPYEQKMSLLNVVIKSHPVGHTRPIKSKDRLIFHVGFRRFSNQPVYSEHTAGDKQKVSVVKAATSLPYTRVKLCGQIRPYSKPLKFGRRKTSITCSECG